MEHISKQLEVLRQRLARIDQKYAQAGDRPAAPRVLPGGTVIANDLGEHVQITCSWPSHHRHGTADLGSLSEIPADLFAPLGEEFLEPSSPLKWAFLDTETTGLAGGSGTMAFLIGVGWISERGFELKQYFLRNHADEPSALGALAQQLEEFELLVTYNGKAYDQPLLETRYRLARQKPPFARLRHLDLLFSARRLWRLALESCRLQDLESRILGVQRTDDPGGALIPRLYFDYLRSADAQPLGPVIAHNATDILSLACLTAIVPGAFREPFAVTRGAEMVGLARWLRAEGRAEEALELMRRAMKRPMPDALVYETLWHIADLERKLGRGDAALAAWVELTTVANPWQAQAYERLAIHYERTERNPAMALEMTRAALSLDPDCEPLRKREARLAEKAARPRPARLL